jgi:hypothetical protein
MKEDSSNQMLDVQQPADIDRARHKRIVGAREEDQRRFNGRGRPPEKRVGNQRWRCYERGGMEQVGGGGGRTRVGKEKKRPVS